MTTKEEIRKLKARTKKLERGIKVLELKQEVLELRQWVDIVPVPYPVYPPHPQPYWTKPLAPWETTWECNTTTDNVIFESTLITSLT